MKYVKVVNQINSISIYSFKTHCKIKMKFCCLQVTSNAHNYTPTLPNVSANTSVSCISLCYNKNYLKGLTVEPLHQKQRGTKGLLL